MTAFSVAMNYTLIYQTLVKNFPRDKYNWSSDDFRDLATTLTVALIKESE